MLNWTLFVPLSVYSVFLKNTHKNSIDSSISDKLWTLRSIGSLHLQPMPNPFIAHFREKNAEIGYESAQPLNWIWIEIVECQNKQI